MRIYRFIFILLAILCTSTFVLAQNTNVKMSTVSTNSVKSSPAYAELLLRKVELEAEVESLLVSYTEEFPKVKEAKFELGLITKDYEKLIVQTDATKLTLALGKLLVRKNQLETDSWILQNAISRFLDFWISRFLDFPISKFSDLSISRFPDFWKS